MLECPEYIGRPVNPATQPEPIFDEDPLPYGLVCLEVEIPLGPSFWLYREARKADCSVGDIVKTAVLQAATQAIVADSKRRFNESQQIRADL